MNTSTFIPTSTPLPGTSKGKKRKTLGNSILDPTETPLKKTLIEEDYEDQEKERSSRRSMAQVAETISSTSTLTKETILPQLDACMKLYTTNKINNTNVWGFTIIDILSEIAKNKTFDKDTLKIAASSLDVGSKVYGMRVDCVHTQTLQLASNMMRNFNSDKNKNNADGENEAPEGENLENGAEPKRRKKAKGRRILLSKEDFPHCVEDENTLLAPIKQLPSNDLQLNYEGFFNQHLSVDHMLRYKYMSDAPFFACKEDVTEKDLEMLDQEIEYPFNDSLTELMNICPQFKNFNCGSNGEEDVNETVQSVQNEPDDIYYDDNGIPIPELDGSIHDPFQDPNHLIDGVDRELEENVEQCVAGPSTEFRRDANVGANVEDVGYEWLYQTLQSEKTHTFVNLWAGPSHWKLKCIKQARTTFTGSIEKEEVKTKRRAKKKEAVEMGFNEDQDITLDPKRKTRKTAKKFPRLPPYQLPKREINEDYKPMESFRDRFIVPFTVTLATEPQAPDAPTEVEGIPTDYNYNNPNDSQYCIDSDDIDGYDDDAPVDGTQEVVDGVDQQQNGGAAVAAALEEDIQWPETIARNDIGFAFTAKKMDMKRLKCAVWDHLVGTNTYKNGDIEKCTQKVIGEKSFQAIYDSLPHVINVNMRAALSVPLAFMALLHLANEKTLFLENRDDDVVITQK